MYTCTCTKFLKIHVIRGVKFMYIKFGGHGLSNFRDFTPFRFCPNFPFGLWTIIVHGGQKIELAQKIHANRG